MTEEKGAEVTDVTAETADETVVDETSTAQEAPPIEDEGSTAVPATRPRPTWSRVVAFAVLPALARLRGARRRGSRPSARGSAP